MTRRRLVLVAALALASTAGAVPKTPPRWELAKAPKAMYAAATLERSFRIEWSARREGTATLVDGYVYNTTNRYADRVRLVIEGLADGHVVGASTTWVPLGVEGNDRRYFETWVPTTASYRVQVLSFEWKERDRRL